MVSCAAYKRLCISWWMVNHQLKLGSRYKWNNCRALWPSLSFLPLRGDFSPPLASPFCRRRAPPSSPSSKSPSFDRDLLASTVTSFVPSKANTAKKLRMAASLARRRRCLSLEKMPMGGPADGRRAEKRKTITACSRYGSKV